MARSNGTTKRGTHHQPEIVTQIMLCRKDQLPACQDRLVEVVYHGGSLYSSWHIFTKMRRQFQKKFGHPIPGVTDTYEGPVRTRLNVNQFIDGSAGEELWWVFIRIVLKDEIVH